MTVTKKNDTLIHNLPRITKALEEIARKLPEPAKPKETTNESPTTLALQRPQPAHLPDI